MAGSLCFGDQIVENGEEQAIGAVGADDEGRARAGNILRGDVDGDLARVRSGMAGGHDQLAGSLGSGVPKVP